MKSTMERIWLKAYPPGRSCGYRPARSTVPLPDLLDESFEALCVTAGVRLHGQDADVCGTRRAVAQSRRVAASRRALARGARVAIMMPNVLQYPVAMAAILRAGYVVVNVNPLYTPRELEHQLIDSGAEAIILLDAFDAVLQAVQRNTRVKHVVVTSMGEMMGAQALARVGRSRRASSAYHVQRRDWRKVRAAGFTRVRSSRMTSRCCNTPVVRRACRKGRRCCIGT